MADSRALPNDPAITDLLLGILVLLADDREHRVRDSPNKQRTELLLSAAGLNNDIIARAVGKNPNAVRMTIARASKSTSVSANKTVQGLN